MVVLIPVGLGAIALWLVWRCGLLRMLLELMEGQVHGCCSLDADVFWKDLAPWWLAYSLRPWAYVALDDYWQDGNWVWAIRQAAISDANRPWANPRATIAKLNDDIPF